MFEEEEREINVHVTEARAGVCDLVVGDEGKKAKIVTRWLSGQHRCHRSVSGSGDSIGSDQTRIDQWRFTYRLQRAVSYMIIVQETQPIGCVG